MSIRAVRGRAAGGLLALAGVLALVPSVFWPTSSMTQSGVVFGPDEQQQDLVSVSWTWGKYGVENAPEGMAPPDTSNALGLGFLLVVIVVGLGAAAAWLLVRGSHGRLLGVTGIAVAASYVGNVLAQRIGQTLFLYGEDTPIVLGTPPAGLLEGASVVLLGVALVVMLWRSLVTVGRTLWAEASTRVASARVADEPAREPADQGGRGRVILHGERRGEGTLQPRPPGWSPGDPDDDRFGPPNRP